MKTTFPITFVSSSYSVESLLALNSKIDQSSIFKPTRRRRVDTRRHVSGGLTFHGDGEGVRGGAVAVEGSALVLAVVLLRDAVEAQPAVVAVQLGARLVQAAVLLLPLHLRRGPADTRRRTSEKKKKRGTGRSDGMDRLRAIWRTLELSEHR